MRNDAEDGAAVGDVAIGPKHETEQAALATVEVLLIVLSWSRYA